MLKRIIPLILLTFSLCQLKAQVPEQLQNVVSFSSFACGVGDAPDGGTSTQSVSQAIFPNNQTTDVRFLCLGDSMEVDHSGGMLFDDGNMSTDPGYSYIFYRCPPSAMFDGEDKPTILMDPCHYLSPATNITAVVPGNSIITADGDATFFNNGLLQALPENMGEPTSIWFAPFTADIFIPGNPGTVSITSTCANVNTDDAFNVVYLNGIEINNINNNVAGNGCQGSMTLTGGLSEWLALSGEPGNDDYTVTITKVGAPSVTGFVLGGWEHGETNNFRVPEAGMYLIEVSDGVSCAASATVNMAGCVPVNFFIGDSLSSTGANICMPVTVSDFNGIFSFQFFLEWDTTIIQYSGITAGDLDLTNFNIAFPGAPTDMTFAFITWTSTIDFMTGTLDLITLNDGDIAFNICFDVVGTSGTSPIDFREDQFEVGTADALDGSPKSTNGSVTIVSNILSVEVGGCSTPAGTMQGSISVVALGGTVPYDISYIEVGNPTNTGSVSGSAGTEIFNNLTPGNYLVTVTDFNGEVQVVPVTIAAAPVFFVDMITQRPSCNGSMDGSITADINGGVMPYDIQWSTGDMNIITVPSLGAGTSYMLTVTDANGCSDVADRSFSEPVVITLDILIQHETCTSGPNDGSISLQNIMGGPTTNYEFLWSGGLGTTNTISNLSPGNYCVQVTSVVPFPGVSCNATFCMDVNPASPPVIDDFTEVPISCPGLNDGELTVNITPGNAAINPSNIDWGSQGTGATITGLGPGTYSVTVTADDGCTAEDSYTLSEGGLTVTLDSVPTTCSYTDNGQVLATVNGAIGTLSFIWSTGSVNSLLTNLPCGQSYSVTVTDSGSGCSMGTQATINLPCPPEILITFDTMTITPVRCSGLTGAACDGSVTVTASAGTTMSGDYNFNWDISPETQNGGSMHTASQLCEGLNIVSVSDTECTFFDTINIPAPPALVNDPASTLITPVSCNGGTDGAATVAVTGGTPPYNYTWNTTDVGPMIINKPAGLYTVNVTDLNLCPYLINLEIEEPDPMIAFINPANTMDASCNGSEDGQIEVAWTGGNLGDPTTYSWTPNISSNSIATDLAPGLYTVTVTDRKDCTAEVSHVIGNPPPIRFTLADIAEPPCFGETTVVQIDQAFGGAGEPFQFSVGGAKRGLDQAIRVLAGEITVTVFDMDNCSADTTILVTQPPQILVNLGPELEEIDLGATTEIDANISPPGLQLEELTWTPNVNLDCIDSDTVLCKEVAVSPLTTTTYTLTAVDSSGCEGSSSVTIEVDKNRNVFIPNAFSPNGDGFNDKFEVLGGNGVKLVNSMRIFDRWGELLFERTNFEPRENSDHFWDGRLNSKLMNPGIYVYVIDVSFIDGVSLLYRGDLTLLY